MSHMIEFRPKRLNFDRWICTKRYAHAQICPFVNRLKLERAQMQQQSRYKRTMMVCMIDVSRDKISFILSVMLKGF